MADVGRLRWILTADTQQFDRAMRRVGGTFRGISRIAVGALGVAGLGGAVRGALSTADAVGKVARAFDLSVESLQRFQFAFEQAGGAPERFNRALAQFTRQIGELQATGGGTLATFLRRTDRGLLDVLFRAQDTEEALLALNRALQGAEGAQRTALLAAAFGRVTPGLANLLTQPPAALAAARGRAPVRFTEQMVRDAERTNDELLRLQREYQHTILGIVVPFFRWARQELQDLSDGVRMLVDRISESFIGRAARFVGGLFD